MAVHDEGSTCIPPERMAELVHRHRLADIENARIRAAQLLDDINRGGGLFAHPPSCGCCGCRAAMKHRRLSVA